jgi:hypothetical protein
MGRRRLLSVLAVVALLAVGLGLWAAAPAMAAPKPIGLSLDGVTYTDDLPTSLYAGALIVPGDTVLRSFYVKNQAADAGNLAVALQGVTGIDSVMVSALSVNADAGAGAGPNVTFPSANPCRSLISGVALAPGGVVRVDVRLTLGSSISGLTSQSSVGSFDLRLTLTSTDVPAPTGCAAVAPPTGGNPGGTGGGGQPIPGEIDSTVVSGAADGSLPESAGASPCVEGDEDLDLVATQDSFPGQAGAGCDGVAAAITQPNTGRFFQEFVVVAWIVLMMLGGIFAAWRRSRDPEDLYATEYSPTPRYVRDRRSTEEVYA